MDRLAATLAAWNLRRAGFCVHCRRDCLVCGLDIVGTKGGTADRLQTIQANLPRHRRIHGSVDRNLDSFALYAPRDGFLHSVGGIGWYLGLRRLLVRQEPGAHRGWEGAEGPKRAGAA